MEPQIQYAKTSDGISIAFWTIGEGAPSAVVPLLPWSHTQLEWQTPELRALYERMATKRRLVRYDSRGMGLSERGGSGFSLDTLLLDLGAVVDHLGLEAFSLIGTALAGMIAIAYAARNPNRVSHLVLALSAARGVDYWQSQRMQAFAALRERDYDLFVESQVEFALGLSGMSARPWSALWRSTAPETAGAFMAAAQGFDTSALLQEVRCPTLVLHWPGWERMLALDVARGLASSIPSARLVLVGGETFAEALAGMGPIVEEFLGGREGSVPEEPAAAAAFRTVLFTDIEGSTALTQRLGDAGAQEILRSHNSIVREALRSCAGREIKHTGDGIMASFASASKALECAIGIQRAVAERASASLRVRIGINAGEPLAEEHDLFGTTVQLARRICDQADGGEIMVSNVVRELVSGKGFLFADTGEVTLKGFDDPVRLYEVRWREDP